MAFSKNNRRVFSDVPEDEFLEAWKTSKSRDEVKKKLNIASFGHEEKRLKELMEKHQLKPFRKYQKNISNEKKRMFWEVREDEFLEVWNTSTSNEEVKRRLNISNFGHDNKRLKELMKKYQLEPFQRKLEEISFDELNITLNNPKNTTLVHICDDLGIGRKIHNSKLKELIKKGIEEKKITLPDHFHKAIYGISSKPWTYPRQQYEKRKEISLVCCECGFQATDRRQIQIHHLDENEVQKQTSTESSDAEESSLLEESQNLDNQINTTSTSLENSDAEESSLLEESKQNSKKSGLKHKPDYNYSSNLITICANCHSLKHHPTGMDEKQSCGRWIDAKRLTNMLYSNPLDMFKTDCPHNHTLQKKYFIRVVLKTPDEYVCNQCGVSLWQGKQLVLQLHHKDSDRSNATLSNLELLCPNCHAKTESWGGGNPKN